MTPRGVSLPPVVFQKSSLLISVTVTPINIFISSEGDGENIKSGAHEDKPNSRHVIGCFFRLYRHNNHANVHQCASGLTSEALLRVDLLQKKLEMTLWFFISSIYLSVLDANRIGLWLSALFPHANLPSLFNAIYFKLTQKANIKTFRNWL